MKIQGSKLKTAREAAGVSREVLAGVADLTRARIWQIEIDETCNLNENAVKAIAKRLKVPVSDLQAS